MKTKINKKIISILILMITLISNIISIFPINSLAVDVGSDVAIQSIGNVEYHLRNRSLPPVDYVMTPLAGYYENGTFYPAYCLQSDRHGADDRGGYDVNVTEIIKDEERYNKLWRVVVAGYPYHTAESLGVSDWKYAYQATKMAIYCVLGQSNVSDFYANDDIGQSVVNLINKLVNIGNNGTDTYKTPVSDVSEVDGITLAGDYYVQKYNLTSNLDITGYTIAISNFLFIPFKISSAINTSRISL